MVMVSMCNANTHAYTVELHNPCSGGGSGNMPSAESAVSKIRWLCKQTPAESPMQWQIRLRWLRENAGARMHAAVLLTWGMWCPMVRRSCV